MDVTSRPLTRLERAVAYGVLGVAAEVGFTAAGNLLDPERRSWRFEGHTYLWMPPIYGLCAVLFEPLHDAVKRRPAWQRASAYAAGIMAVEYATGTALRRSVGVVPWDYTGASRWALQGGAVRLDYAPVWAGAGLGLERVHDMLRRVRVKRAGKP